MSVQRSIRAVVYFAWLVVCINTTNSARADWQGPRRESLSLPERGTKSSGFIVNLACDDIRLFGDVPVYVQVISTGSRFPADRSISVRISIASKSTQPPGVDCVYELPIQIMEGKNQIDKTFYLPKWSVGGEFDIAVIEDRRVINGYQGHLSGSTYYPAQAENVWAESAEQRFGWIVDDDTDKPDARTFFAAMAPELLNVNDLATAKPGFDFASVWRQFRVTNIAELPTDWRGFDAVDVWVVEIKTLRRLIEQASPSTAAFRNYLRCGGTVWILGATSDKELDAIFELPAAMPEESLEFIASVVYAARSPIDYEINRATTYQPANSTRSYIRDYATAQNGFRVGVRNVNPGPAAAVDALFTDNLIWIQSREQQAILSPLSRQDFIVRTVGLGQVIVCKSAAVLPGSPQQWRVMTMLSGSDISETLRRGVDPCFGDRRFWDWIIPDVAQPPVYTFIGLLMTFVVVVGPLAYRKFTQMGRGYLMMFVAPLLALATTLIMFVYGLVADGLSTRARVREVTWIGDTSNTAARYSRSTYFAGVRPASGMQFPANSIVLPYQLPNVASWYEAGSLEHSTIGTIRFDDDLVRMDSGFLPSRQQKQFVTYRPVEDVGFIRYEAGADRTIPAKLTSEMGIELRAGVGCDRKGNYFAFPLLPSKTTIAPQPISRKVAGEMLSSIYGLQRPLAPPAVSSSRRVGETKIDMIASLESRPTRRQVASNRGSTTESAIEGWLRMVLQIESELPPGMFVATADVTQDCIAVDSAEVVESVHFVIGVLP